MNADKLSAACRVLLPAEDEQIAVRVPAETFALFSLSISSQLDQFETHFAGPKLQGLSTVLAAFRRRG